MIARRRKNCLENYKDCIVYIPKHSCVQCAVFIVQCTVCSVQCAVCGAPLCWALLMLLQVSEHWPLHSIRYLPTLLIQFLCTVTYGKMYERANNVCVKKISGKIFAKF